MNVRVWRKLRELFNQARNAQVMRLNKVENETKNVKWVEFSNDFETR